MAHTSISGVTALMSTHILPGVPMKGSCLVKKVTTPVLTASAANPDQTEPPNTGNHSEVKVETAN